jgi:hypothetical protein
MNLFAVDQCLKHNKQPITDIVKEFTNDVLKFLILKISGANSPGTLARDTKY